MNSLSLMNLNDFENNPSPFFLKFYKSIPKEFSKTQIEFIRTNRGKAVSPSYYKYYIDDFNEILLSRLDNLNKNKYFETLKSITNSIDLLYKNISSIYVFCYNRNLNSFTNSVTNYFNHTEIINQFNSRLCIDKYSSNKIDFNETNIFILQSLKYLKISLNKNLFIEMDKTPLSNSFNKLLYSFEKNIDSSLKRKNRNKKARLEMNDFLHKIEDKDTFMKDLSSEFVNEEGVDFFMLINELVNIKLLIIPARRKKDLFIALEKTFERKIGIDKGFYDKVYYNFEKESDQNSYKKDITLNSVRHNNIVAKLKNVLDNHNLSYLATVTV